LKRALVRSGQRRTSVTACTLVHCGRCSGPTYNKRGCGLCLCGPVARLVPQTERKRPWRTRRRANLDETSVLTPSDRNGTQPRPSLTSLPITHSHSLTHATAASCPSPIRSVPRVVNLALGPRQSSEPWQPRHVAGCSEQGQLLAGVDAHAPQ
jgi:hypothetical protein